MILFKSCPKCGTGDLVKTSDVFGAYVACIQCGFTRDAAKARPARMQAMMASAGSGIRRSA